MSITSVYYQGNPVPVVDIKKPHFTKLFITKHVPKYYHYYSTIILLENYQLISVSKKYMQCPLCHSSVL